MVENNTEKMGPDMRDILAVALNPESTIPILEREVLMAELESDRFTPEDREAINDCLTDNPLLATRRRILSLTIVVQSVFRAENDRKIIEKQFREPVTAKEPMLFEHLIPPDIDSNGDGDV